MEMGDATAENRNQPGRRGRGAEASHQNRPAARDRVPPSTVFGPHKIYAEGSELAYRLKLPEGCALENLLLKTEVTYF